MTTENSMPCDTTNDAPVIEIRVLGSAGSGKSTIAFVLRDALIKNGFHPEAITLRNDQEPIEKRSVAHQGRALQSLVARGTSIVINEVQRPRFKDRIEPLE